VLASENVKELMFPLDINKNGKISKQEWMKFMEAEFDRLDKEKKGEIGIEELRSSRLRAAPPHFAEVGK
jgi:Ca2+-binding EF-hand superfamily protein